MTLPRDLKEFIASLNAAGVEYVIDGAHAMAFHGVSHSTGDIDFAARPSTINPERMCRAIDEFGFSGLGCKPQDILEADTVVQIGQRPNRIDILTSIDGVDFDDLWRERVQTVFDGVPVNLISRRHLIANKKATGRLRDLDDVKGFEGR